MFSRRKFLFLLSSLGFITGSSEIAEAQIPSKKPLPAKTDSLGANNVSINDLEGVNITTPVDGQALKFRNNTWINVSQNYLHLEDFGGIADGVTDNSAAVQQAFDALKATNGGTLVFPRGVTKITGNSSVNFLGNQGAVRIIGSGSDSVIYIAKGTDTAFGIQNTSKLNVENLMFIGTQCGLYGENFYDCTQNVFLCSFVEQVTFRDCKFFGIAINAPYAESFNGYAENSNHGIISVNEGDLLVERCYFGGCSTNQCANVNVNSWNGLTVKDCQFFDYGYYNGQTVSKTGATNTAWIRALNSKEVANARMRGKILVERTTFDEGTNSAIFVYGATWVEIDNISVNNGISSAIALINVLYTNIKDSFVGYVNNDTALYAYNCNTIQVERMILGGNVKYLNLASGTPKLIVNHSILPGGNLASNGVINNSQGTVEIKG